MNTFLILIYTHVPFIFEASTSAADTASEEGDLGFLDSLLDDMAAPPKKKLRTTCVSPHQEVVCKNHGTGSEVIHASILGWLCLLHFFSSLYSLDFYERRCSHPQGSLQKCHRLP